MNIGGKQITKQVALKYAGFFVLGLIVLGILTYLFLIQKEKAQFAQAEKEIDALYAQIVEKIGKPDQEKKEKSCGYASRVYGRGPRYCNVRHYLLYSKLNSEESNINMLKISKMIGTDLVNERVVEPKEKFYPQEANGLNQNFIQSFSGLSSFGCTTRFTYPVVASSPRPLHSSEKENFLISLHCGGPAMAEHYPVDNK